MTHRAEAASVGAGVSAREQIVRAAADSLLENGYSGTSVRSIASRAGGAIGNLQYYFPREREVLVPLVLNTVLGFGLYYVVTRDDESCLKALSAFRQLAATLIEPLGSPS